MNDKLSMLFGAVIFTLLLIMVAMMFGCGAAAGLDDTADPDNSDRVPVVEAVVNKTTRITVQHNGIRGLCYMPAEREVFALDCVSEPTMVDYQGAAVVWDMYYRWTQWQQFVSSFAEE